MRPAAALSVVLAGAAVLGGALLLRGREPPRGAAAAAADPLAAAARELPAPEPSALSVGAPRPLLPHETKARFAPVARRVVARRRPSPAAAPLATLELLTPEETTNIVLVIGQRSTRDGLWVRVRLPVLPNNLTGWVPRGSLGGYRFVHTHLVVDRRRLTATLLRDGRRLLTVPIGIGRPGSPTPAGEFYVRNRLSGFGDPFYGPIAFGTNARSRVLTDWPGGGFIGIHGTNRPELVPGRISHGCIRLRNADIVRLSRLMPIGTPVTVR